MPNTIIWVKKYRVGHIENTAGHYDSYRTQTKKGRGFLTPARGPRCPPDLFVKNFKQMCFFNFLGVFRSKPGDYPLLRDEEANYAVINSCKGNFNHPGNYRGDDCGQRGYRRKLNPPQSENDHH
jgi:hypothetical protein